MGKWTIGRQPRARDGNVEEPKWSPRHTLKLHQFINKRFQCKKKQKKQHHWSPLKDWRKSAMKQIVGTHVPAGLAIAPRTVFGLGFLFFFYCAFYLKHFTLLSHSPLSSLLTPPSFLSDFAAHTFPYLSSSSSSSSYSSSFPCLPYSPLWASKARLCSPSLSLSWWLSIPQEKKKLNLT